MYNNLNQARKYYNDFYLSYNQSSSKKFKSFHTKIPGDMEERTAENRTPEKRTAKNSHSKIKNNPLKIYRKIFFIH